jgi:hypothetical protein
MHSYLLFFVFFAEFDKVSWSLGILPFTKCIIRTLEWYKDFRLENDKVRDAMPFLLPTLVSF